MCCSVGPWVEGGQGDETHRKRDLFARKKEIRNPAGDAARRRREGGCFQTNATTLGNKLKASSS